MMKWNVFGRSFERMTGKPNGPAREEAVNDDNTLFKGCVLPIDVKRNYESYWNDLNPLSESVVFVSEVVPFE